MATKVKNEFRNYQADLDDPVAQFYFDNHRFQTFDFAAAKREHYGKLSQQKLSIWDAMMLLDAIVDDSDPDTALSQLDHSLQTAEAIRAAGHPRWLQLTGFIHDLGKVLCTYDEPQWAVVGDTFPLGCAFDERIIYAEFFAQNPDQKNPAYQTEHGIYAPHCGLDAVTMSWGHDEYLYQVTEPYLPAEALYVIRYHSFYSAHSAGAYQHLMNDFDQQMMPWVRLFQPFDLYSKADLPPNKEALLAYYRDLVDEFLPGELAW